MSGRTSGPPTRRAAGADAEGQTRKPVPRSDRTPSGSSSGSGSAAASSLCTVAVGTETDGSVTSPSAAAGLVGIKPTLGLISRAGIVPIAHSQDTAGPMARTVRDAAILLGALAGADARDAETLNARGHTVGDYTAGLDKNALRGARIGVARKRYTGYSVETGQAARGGARRHEAALRTARPRSSIPPTSPRPARRTTRSSSCCCTRFKADPGTATSAGSSPR